MAIGSIVKETQGIKLHIQRETTLGDGENTTNAVYQLPLLGAPSIVDQKASLESPPEIFGNYSNDSGQVFHQRYNQMTEISFSVLASPLVTDLLCSYMMEDGDGTATIGGTYDPPDWTNGIASPYTAMITIEGGGYNSALDGQSSVKYPGCIATSMELSHSIDNESGKPVINITFITAYNVLYGNLVTGASYPVYTGDSATDFISWVEGDTFIHGDGATYRIHPYSYSMNIARPIERVGCQDFTNFEPDGYVMTGNWDISMDITYKRDENFPNFSAYLNNGSHTTIRIGDNSSFRIECQGVISNGEVDTGNPELRNSLSIKGSRDLSSSDAICLIQY